MFIIAEQENSANALLFSYKIADDSWGQTYELASQFGSFVKRPNLTL